MLRENERIDDLDCRGLRIIQNSSWFSYGMDAVLLSNYVKMKKHSTVVDLGTGTGIIPILLYGKHDVKKIHGIEIQEEVAEMASRSIGLNELEEKIEIHNIDLKQAEAVLGNNKYDVVTSNPPYMAADDGLKNNTDNKTISRHETKCTLSDVIYTANRLLKHKGRFFMVHRPNRIVDILTSLREHKLEPKSIRFVHPKVGKAPNLVLIMGVKSARPDLKFEDPLYIYKEDGSYTDELLEIYDMERP